MRRRRNKLTTRVYPILWTGIIVVSIYLLIRFATLSFSDHIGQAGLNFKNALFSNIYCMAMEEGSACISYAENKESQYALPVKLVADKFAIQKFTDDETVLATEAVGYSQLRDNITGLADKNHAVETIQSENVKNELGYYEIDDKYLSSEYLLTNGAVYDSHMAESSLVKQSGNTQGSSDQLPVDYTQGEINSEENEGTGEDKSSVETANLEGIKYTMDQLKDINFLVRNFYIVDKSTKVTEKLFNAEKLLSKDMRIKQKNDAPQILIYHTHSQEGYVDSRSGRKADTVVGVGSYLTDILKEDYNYNVIHDTTSYDVVNGRENRDVAYSRAEDGLTKILKKYPTIEVVIDLHRDAGSGVARTAVIDGKKTAKIMLFNGLSRDQNGPITYLKNPNLQANLAFSLQMQMKSLDLYPGLFIKNYLKSYRFNMHVRPKTLLVELGTDSNTLQSAMNAMPPFAKVLDAILQGK